MPLPSLFSTAMPVEVVASGGLLVRQVDTSGVALDDGTFTYSVALPVMVVDTTGLNEDSSKLFSVHMKVTLDPSGMPVVRVDPTGTAISTALGTIAPTLGALNFDSLSWTNGTAASGNITGATTGSTLSLSGPPTGLTINSAARTWAFDGTGAAGSGSFGIIETLAGATNTPRTTTLNYTIAASGATSKILMEDGVSYILMEDGSKILLDP